VLNDTFNTPRSTPRALRFGGLGDQPPGRMPLRQIKARNSGGFMLTFFFGTKRIAHER
jgi:hypothetical protein